MLNLAGQTMTSTICLYKYFKRPSDTLAEFNAELKALSAEEKQELAVLAAKDMGVRLTDVSVY